MTPLDYIEQLCQLVPDEPITPGVTPAEAEQLLTRLPFLTEEARLDLQAYGIDNILTPRRQLRRILMNTAIHVDADWNGRQAIEDAIRLQRGDVTLVTLARERGSATLVFAVAARAFAMSILPEVALCRPHDRPGSITDGKFPAWHLSPRRVSTRVVRAMLDVSQQKLHTAFSSEEVQDYRGDFHAELTVSLAREVALELNQLALQKLVAGACGVEEDCIGRQPINLTRYQVTNAVKALFRQCAGTPTHAVAGPGAWEKLRRAGLLVPQALGWSANSEQFAGLAAFAVSLEGVPPSTKVFLANFWVGKDSDTLLLVHNVPHLLEGALAACPYRWGMRSLPGLPRPEGQESMVRLGLTFEGALDVVEPAYAVKVQLS